MTIGNRPPVRADGRGPTHLRPVSFTLGVQKWAEGSCLHPGRRHGGPVRGDDRRSRPAAPPRQGHGLGDRRVLDAAAGDRRADRSRIGQGPDRRPDPRDPAADRALAARRRRPDPARRADDHRRLRRPPGRRRDADGLDHRRLRRARRGPHHLRHGAPSRRQGRRGQRSASSTAWRCSTSTTPRTRGPTSTSTSSAPTRARTSSSRARPRASRSTGRAMDGLLDLADGRAGPAVRGPGGGPRDRPAVSGVAAGAARGCSSPPARRTSCASCASCSHLPRAELVSLDDARRRRATRRGAGRRSRRTPRLKAALRGPGDRPADARRRLRDRGRRARRRARACGRGATPARTRPTPTTTPSCSRRSRAPAGATRRALRLRPGAGPARTTRARVAAPAS